MLWPDMTQWYPYLFRIGAYHWARLALECDIISANSAISACRSRWSAALQLVFGTVLQGLQRDSITWNAGNFLLVFPDIVSLKMILDLCGDLHVSLSEDCYVPCVMLRPDLPPFHTLYKVGFQTAVPETRYLSKDFHWRQFSIIIWPVNL